MQAGRTGENSVLRIASCGRKVELEGFAPYVGIKAAGFLNDQLGRGNVPQPCAVIEHATKAAVCYVRGINQAIRRAHIAYTAKQTSEHGDVPTRLIITNATSRDARAGVTAQHALELRTQGAAAAPRTPPQRPPIRPVATAEGRAVEGLCWRLCGARAGGASLPPAGDADDKRPQQPPAPHALQQEALEAWPGHAPTGGARRWWCWRRD
jgi:hypothetical protein